ncbi:ecdysone-inducible gene E3 isoform X1 [Nomia melanderi]|uniref:ecdysone-inducible gene E3 isoform X1 n=2 Tax=Nomia melanderi TaxID=2448451 RepID=UPI003FCDFFE1
MKVYSFVVVLLVHQAIGGTVRREPAFSKPVYSDSYLPAAMQVIFHAVEQLKLLQSDETREVVSSTTPICLAQSSQQATGESTTVAPEVSNSQSDEGKEEEGAPAEAEETTSRAENTTKSLGTREESTEDSVSWLEASSSHQEPAEASLSHQEPSEVNEETPETNYATPEANYELPEAVHAVQETNEEVPEEDQEFDASSVGPDASSDAETSVGEANAGSTSTSGSLLNQESIAEPEQKKKQPTIDSVVQVVYDIVKTTPSELVDEDTAASGESKSVTGMSVEKLENMEDEDDENRFTRLGERVTQVPRPSLTSYLRRAKVPPSATLQQLANLYDSLSKDARKQGFGKYTGYSDEVLNTLETSAEGGVVPQLRKILDKVLERNELTREDARTRTTQAVRDLNNPSSALSKELRPLLPLRYSS